MSKILSVEGVATQLDQDVSAFWCWHEGCPDYGKKGAGNIIIKERYGKNNMALLRCRTCGYVPHVVFTVSTRSIRLGSHLLRGRMRAKANEASLH